MSAVNNITKKLDLQVFSYPGGLSISASNVQMHGDYAKVCFLKGVHALSDGAVLDIVGQMGNGFGNRSAIQQVKDFVLSINKTLRFTDEPNAPVVEATDLDKHTKDELRGAMRRIDRIGELVTDYDREVLSWAEQKGFIISMSYTQMYYTDLGSKWVLS